MWIPTEITGENKRKKVLNRVKYDCTVTYSIRIAYVILFLTYTPCACYNSEDKWFGTFFLSVQCWQNILYCSNFNCTNTLQKAQVFIKTIFNYHRAKCSVIAVKRFSKNVNFNTLHLQQNQSNMSWLHVQEEVMEKYWKRIFGHKPIQIYKSKEYVSHLNCVDSTHIAYALFTLAYNRVKFSPCRFSCCVYPC